MKRKLSMPTEIRLLLRKPLAADAVLIDLLENVHLISKVLHKIFQQNTTIQRSARAYIISHPNDQFKYTC